MGDDVQDYTAPREEPCFHFLVSLQLVPRKESAERRLPEFTTATQVRPGGDSFGVHLSPFWPFPHRRQLCHAFLFGLCSGFGQAEKSKEQQQSLGAQ